jgi:hypothetical protein
MSSNKNNILLVNEGDDSIVVVIENKGAPDLVNEDNIKPVPNIQVNKGARIF